MTQEFMGNMLGVRREGVTQAASKLQHLGVISYSRGSIRVLDRPTLERLSCECYEVVKSETDRLLDYWPQRQVIKDVASIPTARLGTLQGVVVPRKRPSQPPIVRLRVLKMRWTRKPTVANRAMAHACRPGPWIRQWNALTVYNPETDFKRHLEVPDITVNDMTSCFGNFEPLKIFECFAGFLDGIADRVIDALGG
jgi:hypothetical protein